MNVSALSAISQRSQDFDALQNTLRAGNLQGAQTAFAAFLQDIQTTEAQAGPTGLFAPGTQASRDLQAIGGALKSANLPGAQKAFATLQQDIRTAALPASSMVSSRGHRPFTAAEIANNGVSPAQPAANAPSVASILSLKP
jgi:hypothetical protein